MSKLKNKNILLGVTGGIAAYKAAELVRLLRKQEANVRVVMTKSATEFVGPLTFQALSANPVHLELLDPQQEAAMGHISLARWADRIVVVPATADFIAKLAVGMADDLLTTLCLAAEGPIIVAPAMNQGMWHNRATQNNVNILKLRGIYVLGPGEGDQACGETGFGRMMEPNRIVAKLDDTFCSSKLQGLSILISAGPTREAIDPVRFLSNRSSGKMGYALAAAAANAGARVTLISGPVRLAMPSVEQFVDVESAKEMFDAVLRHAESHEIYIGTAAVADYTPVQVSKNKLKKKQNTATLSLERTPDILATVAGLARHPFVVGFAAETDNLEHYAKGKLEQKSLDMIAANWVGRAGSGFESEENALWVFWRGGEQQLATAPKSILAQQLLDLIARLYDEKSTTKNS